MAKAKTVKKDAVVEEVAAVEVPPIKKSAKKKNTSVKTKTTVKTETSTPKKKTVKRKAAESKQDIPVSSAFNQPAEQEVIATEIENVSEETKDLVPITPRRSIAFVGSECHPFVKTGGLGDVMYALPRVLVKLNCDVRVILPRYECIPQRYQEQMVYRGEFYMNLGQTGHDWYVGIMEYVCDGVVYDFIDNQDFFSGPKPYVNLVDDIPKYCYFSKAALAVLNYMNWIPDIIHCHDWQAGLVPIFQKTLFNDTPVGRAKTIMTIHNLRFQGVYNIPTIKYWTGLPDEVFNIDVLKTGVEDANMMKGGLAYADRITTVSPTYALEIQSPAYGEKLDGHLSHHSYKLRGIVNGIDYDMWNPKTDSAMVENYDAETVLESKKRNKLALQRELGLQEDENKYVIGLISRLTDQKGLDLVNACVHQMMDEFTQIVILGTGDPFYEDSFRECEYRYKGRFAACIQYDEARAHRIYAGADALLVPSQFEPCGLTQLNAMHYGTVPIVRETGGLKDTVEPYNMYYSSGNGFTFDRYDANLLLDAVNRSKTVYFTEHDKWNDMILRNMAKDVSWENSAMQYKDLYLELTPWD